MNTLTEFLYVLVFFIVGAGFATVAVVIARLLSPRTSGQKTLATYECGVEPFGTAWIRYSISYFVYALIFIAFDVDILYLFPTMLSYTKGEGIHEYYTILIFVAILALAIIYAWGKGVFTWKRRIQ